MSLCKYNLFFCSLELFGTLPWQSSMICDFLVGILCKSKAIRAKYSEIISIISNILIHCIFDSFHAYFF